MSQLPLKNDCFVTSVTLPSIKALGLESLDWEPEILRDAFEDFTGIPKMKQKMFDKLNCGYMLIGTDSFVSTIEGFLAATAVMNNLVFDESEIPYCTLEQCAWSIWEYSNLLGDIKDGITTAEFCPEIAAYIQEVGKVNGISTFPQWMAFANKENEPLPDLTGDVSLFEMYQARQQDYISDINGFVTAKQAKLTAELTDLQKAGFVG